MEFAPVWFPKEKCSSLILGACLSEPGEKLLVKAGRSNVVTNNKGRLKTTQT